MTEARARCVLYVGSGWPVVSGRAGTADEARRRARAGAERRDVGRPWSAG